jgi:hypothetical protein
MGRLSARLGLLALVSLIALGALCGQAAAQTYEVTNLSDSGGAGDGSLRGELAAANTNPGSDTIDFAPGLSGTIALSGIGLQITDPVAIEGPGPGTIAVAQSGSNRVVKVVLTAPGAVSLSGLHIEGGTAPNSGDHPNYGGDILNDSTTAVADLTITDSLVTGGTAHADGGGIESIGAPLQLISSTVSGNHAVESGGVETGADADFTIEDSTISGNSAEIQQGGLDGVVEGTSGLIEDSTISGNISKEDVGGANVYAVDGGHVTILNTTVAGNTAEGNGGLGNAGGLLLGTDATGTISVEASTIASNRALGKTPFGDGGGVLANPMNATFEDTIIAGNSGLHGPDVYGAVPGAFNLIGSASEATLKDAVPGSDLVGVDPRLGPLSGNSGPTETMALAASSPAVNKGSSVGVAADQRGAVRPVAYPGIANSAAPGANGADIGAYELQAPPPPPPLVPAPAAAPSNHFKLGKLKLNRKKGTALISISVPGPGVLGIAPSKRVKAAKTTAKLAGVVKLLVKAKGKSLRALHRTGSAKVRVVLDYTPTGGKAASMVKKLRLLQKPQSHH